MLIVIGIVVVMLSVLWYLNHNSLSSKYYRSFGVKSNAEYSIKVIAVKKVLSEALRAVLANQQALQDLIAGIPTCLHEDLNKQDEAIKFVRKNNARSKAKLLKLKTLAEISGKDFLQEVNRQIEFETRDRLNTV